MKEKVIAVFDVGKTNKKIILFNYDLKLVSESEQKFEEITDDGSRFFFEDRPYSRALKDKRDFFVFKSFEEGYHQLMVELSELAVEAIDVYHINRFPTLD